MATLTFLMRRIFTGFIVVFVVASLTFLLFFKAVPPIDVARLLAGKAATPVQLAQVAKTHGLDLPWYEQYWRYISGLFHGNLGYSVYSQEPVTTIIKQGLPATVSLVIGGVLLWLIAGLAVGILSATRPRTFFDRTSTMGVLAFVSAPTFVIGQLLILIVFVPLSQHGFTWITTGYNPLSQGFSAWVGALILPWITLAVVQAAVYTRLSRGSLLDTLGEDFIRTARAKGLSERRVLYRHAVRAAMTPVVSQLGVDVGTLLGGVVVVEQVYGMQGVGQTTVQAIAQGDGQLVLGFVIIATVFVVVANLVVDMAYAALDPRVRIH